MTLESSLPIKDRLFACVIFGLRTGKLRKALGYPNADRKHRKQRFPKKQEVVVVVGGNRDNNFCRNFILREAGCNTFTCDTKTLPHPDKRGHILTKPIVQIMQTLLSVLRCGKGGVRQLGQQPIKLLATDDGSSIGDRRLVEGLDNCTKPGWEHCNLKVEQACKYSSSALANVNHFLMLLLSYSLRIVSDQRCPLRDGSGIPRDRSGLLGDRSGFCSSLLGLNANPYRRASRDHSYPDRHPVRQLSHFVRQGTELHSHKFSNMSERILP